MRVALLTTLLAVALSVAGCGSSGTSTTATTAATTAAAKDPTGCPAGWRTGWQALADEVKAPVFCPAWMPDPLNGKIGGTWFNGRYVEPDRSYLVSWAWFETGAAGVQEVHVNFRGYPGKAAIPVCEDTLTVNGKTVHSKLPCFSDSNGSKTIGKTKVTVYTANQGVDQWHVLYAWHHGGSLYTVSEHVVAPYTKAQVVSNLDRIVRGLTMLPPSS